MKKISVLALIFTAFAFPMTSAQAATCPADTTGSGIITVTPDAGTATCIETGTGSVVSTWSGTLLDKSDESGDLVEGALTISESPEGSGEWSFSAPGYTNFVLVIKDGTLSSGFQWGAFSLSALALSGDWSMVDDLGGPKGLSHAELWGSISAVPVPAAVWLFGTALIGFIGFSRRTRV